MNARDLPESDLASPEQPAPETRPREIPPPLSESLSQVIRRLLFRGREEIGRAASRGRSRLELRQLRADRDQFWIRLGKTARRLVEGGEIDHPEIRRAMARIDELEARILALERHSDHDVD